MENCTKLNEELLNSATETWEELQPQSKSAANRTEMTSQTTQETPSLDTLLNELRLLAIEAEAPAELHKTIAALQRCLEICQAYKITYEQLNCVGMVTVLMNCLKRRDHAYLHEMTLSVYEKLAQISTAHCDELIDAGLLYEFIECIHSCSIKSCNLALKILAAIISKGRQYRRKVISSGLLQPLMIGVRTVSNLEQLQDFMWFLRMLLEPVHPLKRSEIYMILHEFPELLLHDNIGVRSSALKCVYLICRVNLTQLQLILTYGNILHMVTHSLRCSAAQAQSMALSVILEIVHSSSPYKQKLIHIDFFSIMPMLLSQRQEKVREKSMQLLYKLCENKCIHVEEGSMEQSVRKTLKLLEQDKELKKLPQSKHIISRLRAVQIIKKAANRCQIISNMK